MIDNLFRIKGIVRVEPEPYYIMIKKEDSVEWREILPKAERIILQHLVRD